MIKKIFKKTWLWIKPYCTWKMLPLFALAWMVTNGWSYVFVMVGGWLDITWMVVAGTAWLSFLWMPFTPEKIVTLTLAGFLYKLIYKEDFKNGSGRN